MSEEWDNLIGQFAPANSKFVNDYNNARTIVDTSAGHASPNLPDACGQACNIDGIDNQAVNAAGHERWPTSKFKASFGNGGRPFILNRILAKKVKGRKPLLGKPHEM